MAISQTLLLNIFDEALQSCEQADPIEGTEYQKFAWIMRDNALTKHREMAVKAGFCQVELEKVMNSVESTVYIQSNEWRERSAK